LGDGDHNSGKNIKNQVYDTINGEIEATFKQFLKFLSRDTSVRVGVCFEDNRALQMPMLVRKLREFGLSYCNAIEQHKKLAMYEKILALWSDWQMRRDVRIFCRFCAKLLVNNLIERKRFDQIITHLPSL
jgi:hypothetical protein